MGKIPTPLELPILIEAPPGTEIKLLQDLVSQDMLNHINTIILFWLSGAAQAAQKIWPWSGHQPGLTFLKATPLVTPQLKFNNLSEEFTTIMVLRLWSVPSETVKTLPQQDQIQLPVVPILEISFSPTILMVEMLTGKIIKQWTKEKDKPGSLHSQKLLEPSSVQTWFSRIALKPLILKEPTTWTVDITLSMNKLGIS